MCKAIFADAENLKKNIAGTDFTKQAIKETEVSKHEHSGEVADLMVKEAYR